MQITICNDNLKLAVDTLGAQMMSLQSADATEYLWQGDPKYWADRSPVLFPFVGRLTDNSYRYHGKVFPMGIHGFAAAFAFAVTRQEESLVTLTLQSNDRTKVQYPFNFVFSVTYALEDDQVAVTYRVENHDDRVMPFGLGGHPGFNVPLLPGERFEDYVLEFTQPCQPDRIGFTPTVYLNGRDLPYPLEDEKRIRLYHPLFDDDAVALKNMDREVTLYSTMSGRGVRVAFPDMPYVGFWHANRTDAPYVCIEPWLSLPSRQDMVEELTCRSDLIQLRPSDTYTTTWTMTLL